MTEVTKAITYLQSQKRRLIKQLERRPPETSCKRIQYNITQLETAIKIMEVWEYEEIKG